MSTHIHMGECVCLYVSLIVSFQKKNPFFSLSLSVFLFSFRLFRIATCWRNYDILRKEIHINKIYRLYKTTEISKKKKKTLFMWDRIAFKFIWCSGSVFVVVAVVAVLLLYFFLVFIRTFFSIYFCRCWLPPSPLRYFITNRCYLQNTFLCTYRHTQSHIHTDTFTAHMLHSMHVWWSGLRGAAHTEYIYRE